MEHVAGMLAVTLATGLLAAAPAAVAGPAAEVAAETGRGSRTG